MVQDGKVFCRTRRLRWGRHPPSTVERVLVVPNPKSQLSDVSDSGGLVVNLGICAVPCIYTHALILMNLLATARSTCRALHKSGHKFQVISHFQSQTFGPSLSTAAHRSPVKWLSTSTRLWRSWDVSFYMSFDFNQD